MSEAQIRKNVVIQEGRPTHCFLLFNHYGHSLDTIKRLVEAAREDFPALLDSEMSFRTYRGTGYIDGMLGCEFQLPKGCDIPAGYVECYRLPSY